MKFFEKNKKRKNFNSMRNNKNIVNYNLFYNTFFEKNLHFSLLNFSHFKKP